MPCKFVNICICDRRNDNIVQIGVDSDTWRRGCNRTTLS